MKKPLPLSPQHLVQFQEKAKHRLDSLNREEKIAQLIQVAAYSNRDEKHEGYISKLIQEHKIGGLTFFQDQPIKQAELTNRYQSLSDTPLFISIDGEWGLAMRLIDTPRFPFQLSMGAMQSEELVYRMGKELARQCRRMGIHANFIPAVDVNNNPENPVIGPRSFGEDKENVIRKALAYMKGQQEGGVFASAKHFPGHGDTDVDSHFDLPVIGHDRERLDAVELYPFRSLIEAGVCSVMVSHLYVPALDPTPDTPATISKPIISGLLKTDMSFQGLVCTDALDMKGVSVFNEPAQTCLKAFEAGNDILLNCEDAPGTIEAISTAIKEGKISEERLDESCLKMLMLKEALGLSEENPIRISNLREDLFSPEFEEISTRMAKEFVTLLSNNDHVLPLPSQGSAVVVTVKAQDSNFGSGLIEKLDATHIDLPEIQHIDTLIEQLSSYDRVILAQHALARKPHDMYQMDPLFPTLLSELLPNTKVICVLFGSPYVLRHIPDASACQGLLIGYEDSKYAHQVVIDILLGEQKAKGALPVNVNDDFRLGDGLI